MLIVVNTLLVLVFLTCTVLGGSMGYDGTTRTQKVIGAGIGSAIGAVPGIFLVIVMMMLTRVPG